MTLARGQNRRGPDPQKGAGDSAEHCGMLSTVLGTGATWITRLSSLFSSSLETVVFWIKEEGTGVCALGLGE